MSVKVKLPSPTLSDSIALAANDLTNFAMNWREIIKIGTEEGFSEKELQAMIRVQVVKQLEDKDFNKKEIQNKLYYMFNEDKVKNRVAKTDRANRLKIQSIDDNKDIEQSSSIIEELDLYRKENKKLKDELENIDFNDNPNVIQISKDLDQECNEQRGLMLNTNATEFSGFMKVNCRDKRILAYYEVLEQ